MAELRICGNSSRAPQCDSSHTRPRLRASISAPLPRLLVEACTVCAATSPLRQPYMMSCRVPRPEGRKLGFLLKLTLNNLVYMGLDQYLRRKTRKIGGRQQHLLVLQNLAQEMPTPLSIKLA